LFDRLDDAREQHSVTLVNGLPGAGKTTLVSSYIESRNLRYLWYQVDSADEDAATFFHRFGQAADKHSQTSAVSLPELDPATTSDWTRFSRQYFREFYDAVGGPLVLVLDDYQALTDKSPTHDILQVACEEAPKNCHIVIASREACPPPLARLRFNHALSVIGADDLTVTLTETRGIAELMGIKLPSVAAHALQARSSGWMMGVVLLLERIRRDNLADLSQSVRDGWQEPVFDYFVAEAFGQLDPDDRDLLMQSALLPAMTLRRVTQLTGTRRVGTLLCELTRRNHFVSRHGTSESAYEFHALFREFLLNQGLLRYLDADLNALRCRAAEVLIAEGADEPAVELLEQARSWRRMVEVILATASTLKVQGRDVTLAAWIKKLPADTLNTNPWLLYWHGSGKALSDPATSQAVLENAYRRFSANCDHVGMALSWSGLVEAIFSIHNDLRQLDPWILEFDERLSGRLEQLPVDVRARVTLAFLVALSFRQPLHPNMSLWLDRVRGILQSETRAAERALVRQHLVTHHLLRGEHTEAEVVLSMLGYANSLSTAEGPRRALVDHVSEAMVAMHVGMGQRCLRAVEEGLDAAEESGDRVCRLVLLQFGAVMSLNRGELARADGFLATFERLAEALPSIDRGAYLAVAAWRRFHAGEPALALQLLGRAVAASQARGTLYYIAVDTLGFALLLHLCGKTSEARRHLEIGRGIGADIRNPLIEYAYHLFSAYIALDSGEQEKAREHLLIGLPLGRQHGYMHFFFFPPRVIARLCLTALESGIETAYVRALIERNELAPDPAWRQAESWPWPLRIYTLGRFGVVKRGVPLRFAGKAQKKPLELLKALIALGGRDVSEAKLADALWPEAEGDAAVQALRTTLFRLRKLIGEEVILRQDGRLTLDPTCCWVDCWAFERLSSDDTADSPVRLERLRKLHQGPFLDGTDDAPWARPLRNRLQAKLARLLGTLVSLPVMGSLALEEFELFAWLVIQVLTY
jgi:ATP/maltotriose-dependent transcriptional regulator MalT